MWNIRRKKKIPKVVVKTETREVKAEPQSFKVEIPPYVPPTDKEIIEGLEWCDNYEAAGLIRHLKKQNMILKGKLTKLTKKYDACEADRQMYMKQLNHLHGTK
jgi:hypothetical protein